VFEGTAGSETFQGCRQGRHSPAHFAGRSSSFEGFVPGSLLVRSANHVVTGFTIPSDNARQAHIHVLVYNLFVPDPGRRTVKRQKGETA
jgi:hypothetical protein